MTIFNWFDAQFAEALAQALIHSLWQGILIISLLVMLNQTGLLKSADRKYLFFLSGHVLLFLCTVASFIVAFYAPDEVLPNTLLTPFNTLIQHTPGIESASTPTFFWEGALVMSWLLGFVFYGFKNIIGSFHIMQMRRDANKAPMHWQRRINEMSKRMHIRSGTILLSTYEASVPFVMGVIRPVIMFPANYFVQLTPAQIEVILMHELVHIGRNDYLLNIIQVFIECMLFFNPATWWLSKRIRRYREYCCDDKVQSDSKNQKTYFEALYHAARISTNHPTQAVALFENNSELIMRMKRMSSRNTSNRNLRSLVMASLGLLTIFGLFAFNTLENRNQRSNYNDPMAEAIAIINNDMNIELNLTRAIDIQLLSMELEGIEITRRNFQIEGNLSQNADHNLNNNLSNLHQGTGIYEGNTKVTEIDPLDLPAGSITSRIPGIQTAIQLASGMIFPLTNNVLLSTEFKDSKARNLINISHGNVNSAKDITRNVAMKLLQTMAIDTNPSSPLLVKLEAEMEMLGGQMEELSSEMEEIMETSLETEMAKIESLSAEMEELAEQLNAQFENSPEMKRLEELSDQLEDQMGSIEGEFEEVLDENMEALQEQLESKAREYENYDSLSESERDKLAAEMKALATELNASSMEMNLQYQKILESKEIKQLQEEMQRLSQEVSEQQYGSSDLQQEMQKLQAEMQHQQQVIQQKMHGLVQDLQNQMQVKAQEMRVLQNELQQEYMRLHSEKNNDDK